MLTGDERGDGSHDLLFSLSVGVAITPQEAEDGIEEAQRSVVVIAFGGVLKVGSWR